jgi:hypothetical protein
MIKDGVKLTIEEKNYRQKDDSFMKGMVGGTAKTLQND